MPSIHIAHTWGRTSALADKWSTIVVYNVPSMAGFSMEKLANAWVKNGDNLDHDGKPVIAKSIEYGDDFGKEDCKQMHWK